MANRLSTGMSKKPWIWPACRSMVSTRDAPAVVIRSATSLALIGTRGDDFAVLPRVAVVRDHRGDALGRGAPERVEHQQQLHQVVVHRRAGRLDDEHIAAAHVVGDLDHHLAVAEAAHVGAAEGHLQDLADLGGQRPVRVAGEYLDLVSHRTVLDRQRRRSWAGRIRTFDTGSKVRGLTNLATAHRLVLFVTLHQLDCRNLLQAPVPRGPTRPLLAAAPPPPARRPTASTHRIPPTHSRSSGRPLPPARRAAF